MVIKKPTFVINSEICRQNIQRMVNKASGAGVLFRPHFKTHQSAAVAEWFRAGGVTRITVSSVTMAKYFALHNWNDITIAFPVNLPEIEEINDLAGAVRLNLLIESVETALFLNENLQNPCGFFIKIDTGYHRTGIDYADITTIEQILNTAQSSQLKFEGFLTHSGNTYHAKSISDIAQIQSFTSNKLLALKEYYKDRFPDLLISIGDTPSCSILPIPDGMDEIRPGNFVFYDVMQFSLGSCQLKDIATALICPVVAMHKNRNEAVIYGGSVHLSKDNVTLSQDSKPVFGLVVSWDGSRWETGSVLGKVISISQEHGIISLTQKGLTLKPGDIVAVLPIHSCLTANQFREYHLIPDAGKIESMPK